MAVEIRTVDWRWRRSRRRRHLVLLCQSRNLHGRGRQVHRPEGDVTPVMQGPVNDTGEKPFGSAELPVSWLLSVAEEQFEFHVSTCAGVNLLAVPTGSDVSGVLQCSRDGWVWSPVRRPDKRSISECPGYESVGFHSCCGTVCDQMTLAPCLLGLLQLWERPRIHPGRRYVLGQQRQ